ncbi:hypothetical protein JL721_7105 [Aureococcus anophagefferens]|nr:hypothetical protein JL721_7105 [Aureococcus anophagefferens]
MYAGSRPKSCDNKARYIPAQNSIQPLGAEAAVRHGATHLPSPRPMSSGDSGLHEMIPMAPEPASARDALREQLAARDRARAALFGAAAAVEAVEEEAVPEDAAASRASLMEAREADRQRRKEEKRRRERREAAKVAAAANVAAERSDDLLRSKRERKSQAPLTRARRAAEQRAGDAPLKARGATRRRGARGAPRRRARAATPLGRRPRSSGDAPRRPDSGGRDGAPTVRFPGNYDEVVKLMNRRDLGEGGDAAGRSWAASSLRAGVGRACGSGDFARYKGVLDDGAQEERMVLGLATIERLDRELRRVQAKARALAGDATDGPGTARSLASSASDAVFLTEKRPRSKRSRFRDRNRAESPPKEDEKPATDFVLDNKHRQGRSLLTMEQEFRALHLALEGDAACDDVLEELAAYGGDEDELRRLADVDAQLRALGRADVVGATIPGAADRAKLRAFPGDARVVPGEGPRAEDVAGAGPVRERGDGPREFHGLDDDDARRDDAHHFRQQARDEACASSSSSASTTPTPFTPFFVETTRSFGWKTSLVGCSNSSNATSISGATSCLPLGEAVVKSMGEHDGPRRRTSATLSMDVHAADDAAAPPRPERGMDAIPLRRAQQEPALVAAALERHSFAVIALGERDARVRDCAASAREFFQSTPDGGKARLRQSFADAGGEGLVGYRRHAAKEVVRVRRGCHDAVPRCPVSLRGRVLGAFDVLERVAVCAWRAARAAAAPDCAEDELGLVVGPGSEAISSSPFDLMYYANDAAAAAEPNSTPHVDSPGLVTAIPVAGRRACGAATGDAVEAERRYRPHADVVVFVDAALQALSRGGSAPARRRRQGAGARSPSHEPAGHGRRRGDPRAPGAEAAARARPAAGRLAR